MSLAEAAETWEGERRNYGGRRCTVQDAASLLEPDDAAWLLDRIGDYRWGIPALAAFLEQQGVRRADGRPLTVAALSGHRAGRCASCRRRTTDHGKAA